MSDESYQTSIQGRVLRAMFQAHAPITANALADSLGVNAHTVSGTLSMITRADTIRDLFTIDKSVRPWTYFMPKKSMSVEDMEMHFRENQKKRGIVKNVSRSKRPGKIETEKDTILIDKVSFPKGTALRLTGDIIVAGIDVFIDIVAEVVKGEGK